MVSYDNKFLKSLIQPSQVHRQIYTDENIFKLEIERIFGRTWNYVGHESQVEKPGDYFTTTIANQPIVMLRHSDKQIVVLHNRCPHRGAKLLSQECGHSKLIRCCYHGWAFRTDGSLFSIPGQEDYGEYGSNNPAFNMSALRFENYRGFIFANLSEDGPNLKDFLGGVRRVIDNMVERSPTGKLKVTGGCFQAMHRNNWKIYLENLHDGVHPLFVHQSSISASQEQIRLRENIPLPLQLIQANNQPLAQMKELEVTCYKNGHSDMRGFRDPRDTDDAVVHDYIDELEKQLGEEKALDILNLNLHNSCLYPNASAHPSFLQMRKIIPVAVDRTIVEAWVFRWEGAPDAIHKRNITYANTVHSPASVIKIDDLEAYRRVQEGLNCEAPEWIDQGRRYGRDGENNLSDCALSEEYIRNQYRAWLQYISTT